jgi:hypothetical protein
MYWALPQQRKYTGFHPQAFGPNPPYFHAERLWEKGERVKLYFQNLPPLFSLFPPFAYPPSPPGLGQPLAPTPFCGFTWVCQRNGFSENLVRVL